MLKEICSISKFDDDFVGLRVEGGRPKVTFPRGFCLSNDEEELRRDIVRLLGTVQRFGGKQEGDKMSDLSGENFLDFPFLSCQYLIYNFISKGYYTEIEENYKRSTNGKINWKKTIQNTKPQMDDDNVIYLDFIVKTNKINTNNLITKIHEFCVYKSFKMLGWLYLGSDFLPKKPTIKFDRKAFLTILKNEINNTFNSEKKMLFTSMINLVNYECESSNNESIASFGVNRFEYVWENLIDHVFGEDNKDIYFPRATWHIINGTKTESSALEPDTIMLKDNKIYILDAKYYKYGITGIPQHLPGTSSIQKQITYGKHIDTNFEFDEDNIYNAFVMPFCKESEDAPNYKIVSVGTADWEKYVSSTPNYYYVLGILLDTTYMIRSYSKHNVNEIEKLSELIVGSLKDFRTNRGE